jgi:hypothetical protein
MKGGYELHTVAVSAPPTVNVQRLVQRSREKDETADLDELARMIRGISQPGEVLPVLEAGASGALLFSDQHYRVVASWEKGREEVFQPSSMERFKGYGGMREDQIKGLFALSGVGVLDLRNS